MMAVGVVGIEGYTHSVVLGWSGTWWCLGVLLQGKVVGLWGSVVLHGREFNTRAWTDELDTVCPMSWV